ncbi:MAG: aminodeoxychorismate synthase component I, partial [Pedobacter sp.]|nr:aminodeoxychorismate synthase component I [Pedobacter sp.]
PIPYSPLLGQRLKTLAHASCHPIWIRPGDRYQEVFSAYPNESIRLLDQWLGKTSEGHISDSDKLWNRLNSMMAFPPDTNGLADMPFRGGLAGFCSYGTRQSHNNTPTAFPAAYFGRYLHWLHVDHNRQTAEEISLVPDGPSTEWRELLRQALDSRSSKQSRFALHTPFKPLTTKQKYISDFNRIKSYLQTGDCYQVNYAQAFKARCTGSSADAMQRLLEVSDPAYAAWISLPEGDVLSLSPELFIQVKGRRIETRPIKGTAPRLVDGEADAKQAEALQQSPKNRAENLMIVDLLRHDIGQHAKTGSVQVDKLFDIESLPQVHHMVSTISATLKDESSTIDLLRDCFPGGSITGAPKKRAMEIIAELEPTPRSIYCGSIGFINFDGDCQFNIAIRTLLRTGDEIYAWAGGGIVADSDCEAEYQECFDKIGALMRALEEMGKEPDA